MSISQALNFPFRSGNLLKILPLAIVYGIIAFLVSYASINAIALLMCGVGIAQILFSLVLGGYYVSSMQSVQAGHEQLPDVDIRTDLSKGVSMFFAGILYFLPLIVLLVLVFLLPLFMTGNSIYGGSGVDAGMSTLSLLLCGMLLLLIPLGVVLNWAYWIGMARFASERNGLFAVSENLGLAWNNAGKGMGFLLRTIAIGIIGGLVAGLFSSVLVLFFPQAYSYYFEPTTAYWFVYAFTQVASYTISLIFGLAGVHLAARYAMQLGIGGPQDKAKREDDPYNL